MLLFLYPSVLTYVLGSQKNHLNDSFEHTQHVFWLEKTTNCLITHYYIEAMIAKLYRSVSNLFKHKL